jgi:hypothetical protein
MFICTTDMSPTRKEGSEINSKQDMTLKNNQILYTTASDRLRNSHGQGVAADAILVVCCLTSSSSNLNRKDCYS